MSLHDRIKEARLKRGLTQAQLGEKIGKAKTTITGWEKDREPTAAQIGALADILCVDVGFLLQDEVKEMHETRATPDEMEHIKKYRALDHYGKDTVSAVLECEARRCQAEKRVLGRDEIISNVIPFRQSFQAASAGTGAYLGPEDFETVFVEENQVTRRASFGVPVQGDSMEPLYHDGDVLMVEGCEEVEPGEIGVFTLDGNGYVKKLGDGELLSLNPSYDPIPMDESIRCNGRVIGVLDPAWVVER